MPRLLFEKKGQAIWISHLDLMRLFQRAFKRAGLPLTHTHGFNPRPSVSIALPLSVGVESSCELLDFALEGEDYTNDEILSRLNTQLVDGVRVLKVYNDGRKVRELSFLACRVILEYDRGVPQNACKAISGLFARGSIVLPKKTKSGMQDQDIVPMIKSVDVVQLSDQELCLDAVVCCQNPSLNPMQLALAVTTFLPELAPSFNKCIRLEVYDANQTIFR